MLLPEKYTTVTPLSKTLALMLVIALPFVGFYFGIRYQNLVVSTSEENSLAVLETDSLQTAQPNSLSTNVNTIVLGELETIVPLSTLMQPVNQPSYGKIDVAPKLTAFTSTDIQRGKYLETEYSSSTFDVFTFSNISLNNNVIHRDIMNPDPYSRYSVLIYFLFNNEKRAATGTLWAENFVPEKCRTYSFLTEFGTLFFGCEKSKMLETGIVEKSIALVGYGLKADSEGAYKLSTILLEDIPLVSENISDRTYELKIVAIEPNKYAFFVGGEAFFVKEESDFLKLTPGKPLDFYVVEGGSNPDVGSAGNVTAWLSKISPTGRYIFYTHANEVGALDTITENFVPISENCFTKLPNGSADQAGFYNNYLDPFTESPYKTIETVSWETDEYAVFRQGFCSAGSCATEGTMTVVLSPEGIECSNVVSL